MKGIVFTEFLELVEREYSEELADQLITQTDPPSGGAYTAVGSYDHRELVKMIVALHRHTGRGVDELLNWFGKNLFEGLARGFPVFFEGKSTAFDVLQGIESVIHTEVRKLYPDAELPSFVVSRPVPGCLVMDYRSPRCMEDLAQGLIEACIARFGEPISVERKALDANTPGAVRFTLRIKDSSNAP